MTRQRLRAELRTKSIPAVFASGMRSVTRCAAEANTPETTLDLRLELVGGTGALFLARE